MITYQYPCSLVAQFTEDVYKNAGASDVLPLVMKSIDAEKVLAVQFLRAGKVRITFDDPVTCATVLKNGLDLGDVVVQLFPADERVRLVHLRDLPVEVDHDKVSSLFSGYGEVLSVDHCYFDEYPSVRNGNRIVKILLTQDIPCFIEVEGCNCRVWYSRQPAQCSICREFGHRAPACPLSGRCRRCRQPGHVARECTQAWGPPPPVSIDVDLDSSISDPVTVPDPDPVVITEKIPDPEPSVNLPPVLEKLPAAVPVPPADVLMTSPAKPRVSKSSRPLVSAKVFCDRFIKHFEPLPFPNYDTSSNDWDSKVKADLRAQVKAVFSAKSMAVRNRDLRTWSENDVRQVSTLFCERMSVRRDFLVDFVFGVVKSLWNNAKK